MSDASDFDVYADDESAQKMRLYTCCPKEDCGGFQGALRWLHSHGIEPSIEHDDEGHYFEFTFPSCWDKKKRIKFNWELAHRTGGMIFCRCGEWLDTTKEGQVDKFTCHDCGREYCFCQKCDAFDKWRGCDCRRAQ